MDSIINGTNLLEFFIASTTVVVAVLLAIWNRKKQKESLATYAFGTKNMSVWAIAMSHIAANVSGIMMLGVPAEIYTYGTQSAVIVLTIMALALTQAYIFLPVLYKFQFLSIFEYCELRYNSSVRITVSLISTIYEIVYSAVVTYGASLVLNQFTGIDIKIWSTMLLTICLFYTILGGYKGIILADNFQVLVIFACGLVVMAFGIIVVGGPSIVVEKILDSDRLELFDMSLDPTIRQTFWSGTVGMYFAMSSHWVGSAPYQRAISLSTEKKAQRSAVLSGIIYTFIYAFFISLGAVMFAIYKGCDPTAAKLTDAYDQIIPYFIQTKGAKAPGLVGLFLAGILGASFSSMATCINNCAVVIYKDYIPNFLKENKSEMVEGHILMSLNILVGLATWVMSVSISSGGTLFQTVMCFSGLTSGATLAVYIIGMFVPAVNSRGILCAGIPWLGVIIWILISRLTGVKLTYPTKALTTENCPFNVTGPIMNSSLPTDPETLDNMNYFYKISINNYSTIAFVFVSIVSVVVSYATGGNKLEEVDPDLISPYIHKYLPVRPLNEPQEQPLIVTSNGNKGRNETEQHQET